MKSILPIILIVAVVGLFFFKVKPIYSEVTTLRQESAEYDHALEMADELGSLRSELSDKLESFSQADMERLDHFLPQRLDTVRIILDIDGIGVRNGINLTDIKVTTDAPALPGPDKGTTDKAKVNPAQYQTVTVSFAFTSTYAQGEAFMKDVEKSLRLFDSANVKVGPAGGKGASLYNFNMDLHTYWINR